MPTYDYECTQCGRRFEDREEIATRNNKHACPSCNSPSPRIPSLVRFNTVFAGSERAASIADGITKMTEEAMDEGFTSRDEIETAKGLAAERAKQLGYDPNRQLIGPVKSPFVGEQYTPDKNDNELKAKLGKTVVEAMSKGKIDKAARAAREIQEHKKHLKTQSSKVKREFKPEASKEVLKSRIKDSRSRRGAAWN